MAVCAALQHETLGETQASVARAMAVAAGTSRSIAIGSSRVNRCVPSGWRAEKAVQDAGLDARTRLEGKFQEYLRQQFRIPNRTPQRSYNFV